MTDLLFETPWWLPTTIIAIGILIFLSGNKRVIIAMRNAGIAIVALGLLLILVSWLVDTDREKVTKRSKQLVQSIVDQDYAKAESLLDPKVSFSFAGLNLGDRATLLEMVKRRTSEIGLRGAVVTSVEPQQTGNLITTPMRVFTDQDKTAGRQLPSDWQLDWQKEDGAWVVTEIKLIKIGDITDEAAKAEIRK